MLIVIRKSSVLSALSNLRKRGDGGILQNRGLELLNCNSGSRENRLHQMRDSVKNCKTCLIRRLVTVSDSFAHSSHFHGWFSAVNPHLVSQILLMFCRLVVIDLYVSHTLLMVGIVSVRTLLIYIFFWLVSLHP
ncbi:hypothetical protein KC19_5G109500 [Ceratodon purpureus]|uniref:Uncharacterized protein n=1 Tax=Ceratodon purpureus TaxID=3225 RepID=A0A8T0I055_CERPU|nr:hypothetical protein KC19_5G109500 [Ceratodon purpureus]